MYISTPERIAAQLTPLGLSLIETMGDGFPDVSARFLTPWYYYICHKARNEDTTPKNDVVTNATALGIS